MADNIFENIDSPNSSAYQKLEKRDGIPLSYVGEKLTDSLTIIHHLYNFVRDNIKDDLELSFPLKNDSFSPKRDGLLFPLFHSFRYSLTSFLALHNILAITNNQKIFDKLLNHTNEDFEKWLNRIISEGSISG